MSHWIGAAANLILGLGHDPARRLRSESRTDPDAVAASFTAKHPMQPRNPGSGGNGSQQLQAWVAGPDASGTLVVLLANYGPDQGQGGFGTSLTGVQTVRATWQDLGISGSYDVHDVWRGASLGRQTSAVAAALDEGQSALLKFTRSSR